ncbi:hypothetical protein ZEAMMB73_Zm00001d011954, partial [Zea mays]
MLAVVPAAVCALAMVFLREGTAVADEEDDGRCFARTAPSRRDRQRTVEGSDARLKGPISGLLKGYVGLSTAIFIDTSSALFADDPASFLVMLAVVPAAVCALAMVFLREGTAAADEEDDGRCFARTAPSRRDRQRTVEGSDARLKWAAGPRRGRSG